MAGRPEPEGSDPERARELYEKARARFPGSTSVSLAYGWFSSQQGNHEEAEKAFVKAMPYLPVDGSANSNLMYFLFLIAKHQRFDFARIPQRIGELGPEHPDLARMPVFTALDGLLQTQIRQIYGQNRHATGFIMFVDLVNSTGYKQQFPGHWRERIVHFLLYTRFAFRYVGFDFIKFIGDEVMLFFPFDRGVAPAEAARRTYEFLFGKSPWYPVEANRFNPALDFERGEAGSPHEIKVKIYIGLVRDALVFSPNSDASYDLVGEDVDRAARIKEMAAENLVVVDDGFRNALAENGGPFARAFSGMIWKYRFKGFSERISFYGQQLGEAAEQAGSSSP